MAEVERVLAEIGADAVPQILVYNKCDRLEAGAQPRVAADWIELHPGVRRRRVFASAITGQGLDVLRGAIADAALADRPPAHDDAPDARLIPGAAPSFPTEPSTLG
jgi:GTP-binding protein HflX